MGQQKGPFVGDLLLLAALILAGGGLLVYAWVQQQKAAASRSWPAVQGEVCAGALPRETAVLPAAMLDARGQRGSAIESSPLG